LSSVATPAAEPNGAPSAPSAPFNPHPGVSIRYALDGTPFPLSDPSKPIQPNSVPLAPNLRLATIEEPASPAPSRPDRCNQSFLASLGPSAASGVNLRTTRALPPLLDVVGVPGSALDAAHFHDIPGGFGRSPNCRLGSNVPRRPAQPSLARLLSGTSDLRRRSMF
jgi:hypothetical protein